MADRVKIFQLPDRALDLDAEDSPYVRPFNEQDAAHQEQKWHPVDQDLLAVKERLSRVPDEVAAARQRLQATREASYHPWRINECDVISVALTGLERPDGLRKDPDAQRRYEVLRQVAHHNAARSSAMEAPSTVAFFMLREMERRPAPQTVTSINFADLNLRISQASSLTELRRSLFPAMSTVSQGDAGLVECGAEISKTVRRLDGLSRESAADTLTMVNNLSANLESRGADLPQSLCHLGIEAASICLEFEALRKYLEIGIRLQYFQPSDGASDFVTAWLTDMLLNMPASVRKPPPEGLRGRNLRSELFTLLTGHSLSQAGTLPSVRDVIWGLEAYAHARKAYFGLLLELGAVRTASHEMRAASPQGPRRLLLLPAGGALDSVPQKLTEKLVTLYHARADKIEGPLGQYLDDVAQDLGKLQASVMTI